jgi:hypothetical protein
VKRAIHILVLSFIDSVYAHVRVLLKVATASWDGRVALWSLGRHQLRSWWELWVTHQMSSLRYSSNISGFLVCVEWWLPWLAPPCLLCVQFAFWPCTMFSYFFFILSCIWGYGIRWEQYDMLRLNMSVSLNSVEEFFYASAQSWRTSWIQSPTYNLWISGLESVGAGLS